MDRMYTLTDDYKIFRMKLKDNIQDMGKKIFTCEKFG